MHDYSVPALNIVHVVQAPRSPHDRVYVLPLLTIKMNKGTGTPPITTPPYPSRTPGLPLGTELL